VSFPFESTKATPCKTPLANKSRRSSISKKRCFRAVRDLKGRSERRFLDFFVAELRFA